MFYGFKVGLTQEQCMIVNNQLFQNSAGVMALYDDKTYKQTFDSSSLTK